MFTTIVAIIIIYSIISTLYIGLKKLSTSTFDVSYKNPQYYEEQLKLSRFLAMKSDYMNSALWQQKRIEVLNRENKTCQLCSSKQRLEIHHLNGYSLIPNEPISHLACLCRSCHQKQHELHGYPRTYNEYMAWNTSL